MRVRILLFSVLRERLGQKEIEVSLDRAVTAGELWQQLAAEYADLEPYGKSVKFAVNQTYVDAAFAISDGDEVALITPVSGG